MSNIKTALVLYPNQLFDTSLLPKVDLIYVVEDPLFFGVYPERQLALNKKKLILHRASMRRYVEELLWQKDLNVEYIELEQIKEPGDVLIKAQKAGFEQVILFDVNDHLLEAKLKITIDKYIENPFELKVLPTPAFMLKRSEVKEFFARPTKHKFSDFYQWQRERFNILIDKNYHPAGEKWMFDYKRSAPSTPQDTFPGFEAFGDNQYVTQAKDWVQKHFGNNPGTVDNFFWPTDHDESKQWLGDFIKNRLNHFAEYGDYINSDSMFMYHSGLSTLINSGFLTPQQVIDEVIKYNSKSPIDMVNLEGFIRRIIGWREYTRGLYVSNLISVPKSTARKGYLNPKWLNGETGLPPLDDCIKKSVNNAYLSSNERTMIVGNLMLLTGLHPVEIYKWFMSLFIDAYDWVVQPNVFAMCDFNDMGDMLDKTYIADSDYILTVSNYQKDLWCDILDGLFWNYVDKHRAMLANNPTTAHMVKNLSKISAEHRRIINYRAQDFLTSID